jgi:hypothetical protein
MSAVNHRNDAMTGAMRTARRVLDQASDDYRALLDAYAAGVNAFLDGGVRDSIDLSAYSRDSSTNAPRMSLVTAHGGNVFVALQRFEVVT